MEERFTYRAWHKPTKKMFPVYGFNRDFVFEDTMDGICTSKTNPARTEDCELMQCIGLKDKNGRLIYEGDIVIHESTTSAMSRIWGFEREKNYEKSPIVWSKGKWRVGPKGWVLDHHVSTLCKELVIVGNIHENPELIGRRK